MIDNEKNCDECEMKSLQYWCRNPGLRCGVCGRTRGWRTLVTLFYLAGWALIHKYLEVAVNKLLHQLPRSRSDRIFVNFIFETGVVIAANETPLVKYLSLSVWPHSPSITLRPSFQW